MSYCKRTKKWYPASEMTIAYNSRFKKELVGPDVSLFRCEDCEKVFISAETERYTTRDGRVICGFCYDDWYCSCRDCGDVIPTEDAYYIEGYGDVCSYCYTDGDYNECVRCGEHFLNQDLYRTDTEEYICSACRDDFYRCEECGNVIYSEDYYEDEDSEEILCYECYHGSPRQSARRIIHDYSYKPCPNMHRICNEKKTDEFFGFEIEVEGGTDFAEQFLEEFGDTEGQDLYLKRDGSVAGFEIVTHPMTRRYFKSKFVPKLAKGMAFLRKNGFRGHNRAGIHIHVSNNAISQQQLKKLMLLLYPEQDCIYKKWLAITQRHDGAMRSWARMDMEDTCEQLKLFKTKTKKLKKDIAKDIDFRINNKMATKPYLGNSGRYTAINVTGPTVEFRIFNSNIRTERIIKNAQVIFSLLDFTKEDILPTFHNYMRYVEDNRGEYRELWEFLLEKHIYIPRINKEKTKEIVKAAQAIDSSIENYEDVITTLRNLNSITTEIDDNDETLATIQEGGAVCA